jgi:chitin synthase
MNITNQKYFILSLIAGINTLLSATFIKYTSKWYFFIPFLALESVINSFSSLMILGNKLTKIFKTTDSYRISPRNYLYVVPCYNESEDELTQTLDSLVFQQVNENDKRLLCIVCDGKVKGQGNETTTDIILKKILNNNDKRLEYKYNIWSNDDKKITKDSNTHDKQQSNINKEVKNTDLYWDDTYDEGVTLPDNNNNNNNNKSNNSNQSENNLQIYSGKYKGVDYILLVKEKNVGKRDSLVLIRRLCYYYNLMFNDLVYLGDELSKHINTIFSNIFYLKLDYIIGIDADTVFDINCTNELIKGIESEDNVYGCVGYVDISPDMNRCSLFTLYQYGEYMYSQCLKRYAQSLITKKVSCLSGCNQILRVSEETCGEKILNAFNRLPKESENIFNHIRSYASEDRNHVCLMLSMYPYVKTLQNIKAIAYTKTPTNIGVFASQRRRWNLGANCNDMLLTYLPGINIFERISAFTNILTFTISPFIFIATIYFIKALSSNPPILMLYLSIIMIIPFIYSILIPIVIRPVSFKNTMYYYLSFIIYLTIGSVINLGTYTYALLNMDIIRWGKTRTIIKDTSNNISNKDVESESKSITESESKSITESDKSISSSEFSVTSLINNFEKYIRNKNNDDIYMTVDETILRNITIYDNKDLGVFNNTLTNIYVNDDGTRETYV